MSNPTAALDIGAKLWSLCHVLRDDGVTYHQYLSELTYLLFLKMMKETGQEERLRIWKAKDKKQGSPKEEQAGTRWDDLLGASAPDRLDLYKEMLLDYGLHGRGAVQEIYANANTFITKPATLSKLVTDIDRLDWYSVDRDDLGDLYEDLLERNAGEKKSGAGQYFTPRHLIDSIVSVMKPQLGDVIQDPAAGTCGFLIAANNYLRQHNDFDSLSDEAQRKYRHQTFHGMELVQDTHRLALMNMLLHGIEGGVTYGDTLSDDHKGLPPATLILSNPPFGTKKGGGLPTRGDLTFETSNKQFAFLQHIYRALKPGGRAAVVLPDNVLFESNIGADIRRDLMDKCNLHTIVRLPTGIFYAQGVKPTCCSSPAAIPTRATPRKCGCMTCGPTCPPSATHALHARLLPHAARCPGQPAAGQVRRCVRQRPARRTGGAGRAPGYRRGRALAPLHARADRTAGRQPGYQLAEGQRRCLNRPVARRPLALSWPCAQRAERRGL